MSFSASRLFSADTSMSIEFLLVRATAFGSVLALPGVIGVVVAIGPAVDVVKASELHLHPAWAEFAEADRAPGAVDFEHDAVLIRVDDSSLDFIRISGRVPFLILIFTSQRHDHEPAGRAPPVPGLG